MQKFDIGLFLIIISFLLFLISILPNIGLPKKTMSVVRFICALTTLPIALIGYYMIILSDNQLIILLNEKYNLIPVNKTGLFLFGITFITLYFSSIMFIALFNIKYDESNIKNNKTKNIIKEKHHWYMNPVHFSIIWATISILILLLSIHYLKNKDNTSSIISLATLLVGIMVAWLAFITASIRTEKYLSKEIANKRQEWINDFRDNIAQFTEICSRLKPDEKTENGKTNPESDVDSFSFNKAKLSMLIYKIILLMNPKDYLAKAIFEMMKKARNSAINESTEIGTLYKINHIYCVALSLTARIFLHIIAKFYYLGYFVPFNHF